MNIPMLEWSESSDIRPECNDGIAEPHTHFAVRATFPNAEVLLNGVRLRGRLTEDARRTAQSLLRVWLEECPEMDWKGEEW